MFIPDYSNYEKILIAPDGTVNNDIYLAKSAQSQELGALYDSNLARSQDVPTLVDYDSLDDAQMFDACVDKNIETPEDFLRNYNFIGDRDNG